MDFYEDEDRCEICGCLLCEYGTGSSSLCDDCDEEDDEMM